ncbi:MAG: hypothetical protein IJU37_03625 [Desulfovibrio sp.]|nr:hypothetical protein [Desulfovibrio sp.]
MIESTCLHWKDQYIKQGKKEGKKEGECDGRMAVARKLPTIHMDEDQIMSLTDLSREDVQRLTAEALSM